MHEKQATRVRSPRNRWRRRRSSPSVHGTKKNPLSVTALKDRLKQVMERDVFVVRNKDGLKQALREIDAIEGGSRAHSGSALYEVQP